MVSHRLGDGKLIFATNVVHPELANQCIYIPVAQELIVGTPAADLGLISSSELVELCVKFNTVGRRHVNIRFPEDASGYRHRVDDVLENTTTAMLNYVAWFYGL